MNNIHSLIKKYDVAGPRYTSYPTALHFSENEDKSLLAKKTIESNSKNLSLYVHIPFCQSLCWFCACSSSVCTNFRIVDEYLNMLDLELHLWKNLGLKKSNLSQIHFGGGTPNFLSPIQIFKLKKIIEKYFSIEQDCEFSVELDPRTLDENKIKAFSEIGVNRASLGLQDTNLDVQKAIHRIQPIEKNIFAFETLRKYGIKNINADLVYGLPLQTPSSFEKTLDQILQFNPSRIALFNYAHVPWVKPSQKNLEKFNLPSTKDKVDIFLIALQKFNLHGFDYIGLDHFAKSNDELVLARKNKSLQRNFQGYSTKKGLDSFAIGLTSISQTSDSYRQNKKNLDDYQLDIKNKIIPIERGLILSEEDIIVREIIREIMCSLRVDFDNHKKIFSDPRFSTIKNSLAEMQNDGLIEIDNNGFSVSNLGRIFLRNIAMLFDLRSDNQKNRYSKTL